MTADSQSKTSPPRGPCPARAGTLQISRRGFVRLLGAGLLITVTDGPSLARRSNSPATIAARLHIGRDGSITVMTGKVEEGQGARAQITQAAAEELGVAADDIRLVMADTALVPDDGITAGSRTTPYTVPAVRRACAAARNLLLELAARQWKTNPAALTVSRGAVVHKESGRKVTYARLAESPELPGAFARSVPRDVALTAVSEWRVLGSAVPRPNRRDLVTGAHRYPSDVVRPDMLYGKILRPPAYGATLESIDLASTAGLKDVVTVRDGQFVGCAAPSSFLAGKAIEALAETARWKTTPQVSSNDLFDHLRKNARPGGRSRGGRSTGSVENALAGAEKVLEATYKVAYIQHVPMEPRAAVAEWNNGNLTVWTGVDWPQRAQRDLAATFRVPAERVRVVVPDMGGGFGGKHTAEAAEEAARLAKAAKRPVAVHWTRAEEFTWAYFRPAALIEVRAGLGADGGLSAWDFTNINAGGSAISPPYDIPNVRTRSLASDPPLRQGPYRCLAATANNFARESFIDELAAAAGKDPLEFRLAHASDPRLRAVLERAAGEFDWASQRKKTSAQLGAGLACGTEKGSYVAACASVRIDRKQGLVKVLHVCEAFECGPVQNPANLVSQVQGCIIMGLGALLREQIVFEDGRILNASFASYRVPRFADAPTIDVHLLDKTDVPSAGGGETPIIAIAPAVANAVFAATGLRIRSMPIRPEDLRAG